MKNRITFLSTILLCVLTTSIAQENVELIKGFKKKSFPSIASRMTSGNKLILTTAYKKGYIITTDGEKKEGDIQLKIVNTDTTQIKYKKGKEKLKLDRLDVEEFGFEAPKMSSRKVFKNPQRNFQKGYILLNTGHKVEGKLAVLYPELESGEKIGGGGEKGIPKGLLYVDNENNIYEFYGKQFKVVYFVQTILSEEVHRVNINGVYAQVRNPKGRFSYYKNPRPTHERKGTSNLISFVASEVKRDLAEEAAEAAAKQSIKESKKNNDDLGETIGNATVKSANTYNDISSIPTDNLTAFFEEYYVVDNKKGTTQLIYKKDIKEKMGIMLDGCSVSEDQIKEAAKIADLDRVILFLEEKICD